MEWSADDGGDNNDYNENTHFDESGIELMMVITKSSEYFDGCGIASQYCANVSDELSWTEGRKQD